MQAVDLWAKRIHRWLWPPTCLLCMRSADSDHDLCCACRADLPLNTSPCKICGQPLAEAAGIHRSCGTCLRHSLPYHRSVIPFRYAYPLDYLIQAFKYRRDVACGRLLGELLAQCLLAERRDPLPQLMIPVPLARRRYRERGYNQATELALQVRKATGLPLRTDLAIRCRETREQAELNRKERRINVRRAFQLVQPLPATHIAIIDDVVTTGSTVNELAKLLRRAGAQHIEVWAIARAGKQNSRRTVTSDE